MKFNSPQHINTIVSLLNCEVTGNLDQLAHGMNEIHMVEKGDIVFVDHPKYFEKALESAASFIIINEEVACPDGKTLFIHPHPFDAFNQLSQYFLGLLTGDQTEIHESAVIAPNVFLGKHVRIGENVHLHPGVHVGDFTTIEANVVVGPNTVIGFDAFYYKKKPDGYDRLKSCGGVHIAANVEIGALCTIDRGVTGWTKIGHGTKIDNQVHIGHDTQIGEHCLIAAACGISGCVEIGDHVTLWGQVGTTSAIKIGNHSTVLGQSGISKNVPENEVYFGTPAGPVKERFKELAHLRQQAKS